MRLVRYGPAGSERPGMIDAQGNIRDLSAQVADIDPAALSPTVLARLAACDPDELPLVSGPQRLGIPFTGSGKFIGVGFNYADHAAEVEFTPPDEPLLFTKAISCLSGPNDPVISPKGATKFDWEVEMGVVIGRTARHVDESASFDHIAGFCVVNDLSERAFQFDRGGTWDKGKGCDTFGPVGPWLVTTDEIGREPQLDLWLEVNGQRRQSSNTRHLIFPVVKLVSYISQFMTLTPGDIISTGTPSGIGMSQTPPVYLKPGDVMTLGVEGLGEQRQVVVAWDEAMSTG